MSLDTAAELASAAGILRPWGAILPITAGTIDQSEMQAAVWLYSGILAGSAAPAPSGLTVTGRVGGGAICYPEPETAFDRWKREKEEQAEMAEVSAVCRAALAFLDSV